MHISAHAITKWLWAAAIAAAAVTGICCVGDFGMAWDEPAQRQIGIQSLEYARNLPSASAQFADREYPAAFEMLLAGIEQAAGIKSTRHIYLMRHLVSHFFFLMGCFTAAFTVYRALKSPILSLAAFCLLYLYPPFFGHSFFNSKDLPFVSMLLICTSFVYRFLQSPTRKNLLLLSITSGLLINFRLSGLLFLFLVSILVFAKYKKEKHSGKRAAAAAAISIFTGFLTLYLTWPYLWFEPFSGLVHAVKTTTHFHWNNEVLFDGRFISASALPWYYIPRWIILTTPIGISLLAAAGIVALLTAPIVSFRTSNRQLTDYWIITFLLMTFGGLSYLASAILNSTLYDGWRHFYFLYPAMVFCAIYALNSLRNRGVFKATTYLLIVYLGITAITSVRNHPYEHLYFNEYMQSKAPDYIRNNYEFDYWGTSFKEAFIIILNSDKRPTIKIHTSNQAGVFNALILPENMQKRIVFTYIFNADYFVTNYRNHPQSYEYIGNLISHSKKAFNNTLFDIFKLR